MKKILVTGGAGFIGANLVRMLLQFGYRVAVLDNLSAGKKGYLKGLDIEFIEGNVLNISLVNRLIAEYENVVHLAAQAGVSESLADPQKSCMVNVVGTLNMLHTGCRHFIFASSNAVLGERSTPARENKVPLPVSSYGASKLAGEAYVLAYHGVVLRFSNVYGPFSAHKNSVVAQFLRNILTRKEITIEGDGQQTRDFIYVYDVCSAILSVLESDISTEIFQIGTGIETRIIDLAAMVADQTTKTHYDLPRSNEIQRNYSDITKAKRMLGWEPQVGLTEGLEKTLAWWKTNVN